MKFILCSISVIFIAVLTVGICKFIELKNIRYNQPQLLADKKILTVYYSNGGNTKTVAQTLHSVVGGDIKEIELTEQYPKNIFEMSKLIRKQKKEGVLPKTEDIDISDYDVIFVGSPVWVFSAALPTKSFLKSNNFENKTLIPFFTCGGGVNKNKIYNEIKASANAKDFGKTLVMFENGIFLTKEQIIKWLNNL